VFSLAVSKVSKDSRSRLLALTFILLNLADSLIILSALNSGSRDLDFFLQHLVGPGLAGTVLFKIGGSAFFAWIMYLYRQHRVLKIAVSAMIAVCLLNLTSLHFSNLV
jgi:hypothetical protein